MLRCSVQPQKASVQNRNPAHAPDHPIVDDANGLDEFACMITGLSKWPVASSCSDLFHGSTEVKPSCKQTCVLWSIIIWTWEELMLAFVALESSLNFRYTGIPARPGHRYLSHHIQHTRHMKPSSGHVCRKREK